MNLNQDIVYARIVKCYQAYISIKLNTDYVSNLVYLQGMVAAFLECAYLPEDREQMRQKAWDEALELYNKWVNE